MGSEAILERDGLRLVKGGQKAPAPSETDFKDELEGLKILALAMLREIEVLSQNSTTHQRLGMSLSDKVRRFESHLIRSALIRTGGRQRRAARLLGMKVTTLHTKIKRYQIDASEMEDRQ